MCIRDRIRTYLKLSKVVIALDDEHQLRLICEMFDRHGLLYTLVGIKDKLYPGLNLSLIHI